jgi:hypothetical protein
MQGMEGKMTYAQVLLHLKSEAGKQLKMDEFLKKPRQSHPLNTSSEILTSTSMTLNAKLNIC